MRHLTLQVKNKKHNRAVSWPPVEWSGGVPWQGRRAWYMIKAVWTVSGSCFYSSSSTISFLVHPSPGFMKKPEGVSLGFGRLLEMLGQALIFCWSDS